MIYASLTDLIEIENKGAAGHSCAETLRQEGFTGRVIIVTKDEYLPYDRTKLSKAMNLEAKLLSLRSNEYYSVILIYLFVVAIGVY